MIKIQAELGGPAAAVERQAGTGDVATRSAGQETGQRPNSSGRPNPGAPGHRGQHELLRAFIVKNWGQAPAKQRDFLGFACDGRSQSPFFHKQPIQERRLHRAWHQCQLTRTTGFILAPSSAATRVSSRTPALILAYAQNIGWTYVPRQRRSRLLRNRLDETIVKLFISPEG